MLTVEEATGFLLLDCIITVGQTLNTCTKFIIAENANMDGGILADQEIGVAHGMTLKIMGIVIVQHIQQENASQVQEMEMQVMIEFLA